MKPGQVCGCLVHRDGKKTPDKPVSSGEVCQSHSHLTQTPQHPLPCVAQDQGSTSTGKQNKPTQGGGWGLGGISKASLKVNKLAVGSGFLTAGLLCSL